jgi:hypothetical protein
VSARDGTRPTISTPVFLAFAVASIGGPLALATMNVVGAVVPLAIAIGVGGAISVISLVVAAIDALAISSPDGFDDKLDASARA